MSTLRTWFEGLELPGLTRPVDGLSQRIGVSLYRILAEGQPVEVERLASELGEEAARVREALTGRPGVVLDATGRVTAYMGLTLKPSAIEVEIDGVRTFTWCAWDTMLVAHAIGRPAVVNATCPVTQRPMRVDLPLGGPVTESSVRMSMVTPSLEALAADFHAAFCARVHFLANDEAGAAWVSENPDGQVVSLQEAWRFAAHRNAVVLGREVG